MAQDFAVGTVISNSLSVLFRNVVTFAVVTVVGAIPMIVLLLLGVASFPMAGLAARQGIDLTGGVTAGLVVFFIIAVLTYLLIQSAISFGTFQDLRGERARIGDCIGRGLAVLPRVFLSSILLFLVFAVIAIVGMFVGSLLLAGLFVGSTSISSAVVGSLVTMLVTLAPLITMAVIWWVFVPAIVVERAGSIACFGRSSTLTRGNRWRVFGVLALLFVTNLIAGIVVGLITRLVGVVIGEILNAIVSLFFMALSAVMAAVGYYYLRADKEGFGVDDLAKVFD